MLDLKAPGLENADAGLRAAEAFLKKWSGDPLILPAVGPHAAYTARPETLLRAKALADRYHAPLTIHAAESPSEMEMIQEKYGTTTVAHLDKIGFLGPNRHARPRDLAERRRDRDTSPRAVSGPRTAPRAT